MDTNFFDAFETLELERRLGLGDGEIEAVWQRLSRELHPDADTGDADRAAAVNRARGILQSPGQRLRHWLELHEVVLARHGAIGGDLMALFAEVGSALAAADEVLKRRAAASSALAKALLTEPAFTAQQKLQNLLGRLQRERLAVTDRFPGFDEAAEGGDFTGAIAAAGHLGFLEKWESQCRERVLAFLTES